MPIKPSEAELDELFSRTTDALLIIEGEYVAEANKVALDLLGISSVRVFRSLHPAKISPEFQPDGESSKLKANRLFSLVYKNGYCRFKWQHIKIDKTPFDVEVSLRKREEKEHIYIDVHWKVL